MKIYIYFILASFAPIACKAQSPIYDISEPSSEKIPGSYFKDLNELLDGYDGTYLYTKDNTSFKIALKKKVLSYGYHYQDLVVGEFQFIKNSIEIHNTLANININYIDEEINHLITGNQILKGNIYGCPDCLPTEKRLRLSFVDEKAHRIIGLDIRKTIVNSLPAINVTIFDEGSTTIFKVGDPRPSTPILEFRDYLMIKQ